MQDHRGADERAVYCPIMKEVCLAGRTKSMGDPRDGQPAPRCVAWRPVSVQYAKENKTVEVQDCVIAWTPDLIQTLSDEISFVNAETNSVRKAIDAQMGSAARAFARLAGLMRAGFRRPLFSRADAAPQITNGEER